MMVCNLENVQVKGSGVTGAVRLPATVKSSVVSFPCLLSRTRWSLFAAGLALCRCVVRLGFDVSSVDGIFLVTTRSSCKRGGVFCQKRRKIYIRNRNRRVNITCISKLGDRWRQTAVQHAISICLMHTYAGRYCVRYTSSLYALEIAERAAAAAMRDIPWYFNTCCVVGNN